MKYTLGREGIRLAWAIIDQGRRIVEFAEKLEIKAREPDTALCRFAWRLMTFGERILAMGEALEGWVDQWARNAGCEIDFMLMPLTRCAR